ncbi:MAG: hypothetical protein V7K21_12365 [Nostoc sp.]|uniref:hypothetical protein n=1 Tax=Nostoc sp. TaxID=1180 RepID=UPI002FF6D03D
MITINQIIGDSPNQICANFGKRFFAWMMAQSSGTAGFASVNYERFDTQVPIISFHIIGVATK